MRFRVILENPDFDYDTVKNYWLSDYKTEDCNKEEREFYIELDTAADIIDVSNQIGCELRLDYMFSEAIMMI